MVIRKVAFLHHVRGQPCEQKIPIVVAAKQSAERSPGGALPEDMQDAGWRVRGMRGVLSGDAFSARHPPQPRNKPDQAGGAQNYEKRPPSETRHQQAADKHSQSRTEFRPGVYQTIGESAVMLRKIRRESLRITGVRRRLSHPEQKPQSEQGGETASQTR